MSDERFILLISLMVGLGLLLVLIRSHIGKPVQSVLTVLPVADSGGGASGGGRTEIWIGGCERSVLPNDVHVHQLVNRLFVKI
ncbi:MAG: hypothetical protein ABEJ05_06510, partial [Haloglomus sp.]